MGREPENGITDCDRIHAPARTGCLADEWPVGLEMEARESLRSRPGRPAGVWRAVPGCGSGLEASGPVPL